jgi:transcription initiation factor TFIIH subunit 4
MKLKYYSLFELLRNEPKIVINKIYSTSPTCIWACQAIFQSLSTLSRYLIMRFLFLDQSFKISELFLIMNKAKDDDIMKVFDELHGLDLIVEDSNQSTPSTTAIPKDFIDLTTSSSSGATNQKRLLEFSQNHNLYRLNKSFQQSLIQAITNPVSPWFQTKQQQSQQAQHEGIKVSKEFLEEFRTSEWNKVLSFLVGLNNENDFASKMVPLFMYRSGLLVKTTSTSPRLPTSNNNPNNPHSMITAKGYEFLLKDYYHQVWDYVTESLSHQNKEENMSLLFMLSYTNFGESYSVDILTKSQNMFLFELSQIGIIYLPSIHSKFFYPTKTIINLIFGSFLLEASLGINQNGSGPGGGEVNQGNFASPLLGNMNPNQPSDMNNQFLTHHNQVPRLHNSSNNNMNNASAVPAQNNLNQLSIIVETNLQVIAYVTNDLHAALLRFFIDVQIRMPNMVIGRITRDKSKEAFKIGMKSEQIIDFLVLHAHPVMKKRSKIIPENVIDQLILWEAELSRLQMMDAIVIDFTSFIGMSELLYESLLQQLHSKNLVLWDPATSTSRRGGETSSSSSSKMIFACHPDGQEIIHNFLNSHHISL